MRVRIIKYPILELFPFYKTVLEICFEVNELAATNIIRKPLDIFCVYDEHLTA
jgi:hypothetical protein